KERGIIDLDLRVEAGEIFGFIGPNGAGKSTTIRTLLGFIFPTSGCAEIFGMDIVRDTKKIKKRVGYLPSEVDYYEKMNVHELLAYSASFYGTNCEPRIRELADIFDLDLDRKIIDLSRGNRKKVSILQSIIHRPQLLICDEPTSGLDPLMQAKFFDVIKKENSEGTTVFLSSHTLSEVQKMCRKVGIIKEGKMIAVEDIEDLRKKQLRKIQVEFVHVVKADEISCYGMTSVRYDKNIYSFLFSGNMNDFLRALAGKAVKDIIIEEPSLEEIFMHYYSERKIDIL
ncbi:MAG: ABC transporter ATP-binding protein, partial [Candidatus Aminicenantes bacterium]|nr:ABC transporter ATP-binding protein [Candidatus Aminicenantes bacterium]